ncbi:hypothetical protein MRX96_046607, partial [Rhipicephalus microplus]
FSLQQRKTERSGKAQGKDMDGARYRGKKMQRRSHHPPSRHEPQQQCTEGHLRLRKDSCRAFSPLSSLPAEHGRPLDVRCILMVVRRAMEGRAATEQHRERGEGTASLRSLPEASLDGGPVHLPLSYTARTGDAPSRTGGGPRGTFLGPIVISDERDSGTSRCALPS